MTTTTEQPGTTVPQPEPNPLISRAVFLRVSCGKVGVRRKAKATKATSQAADQQCTTSGAVLTDADVNLVSVSKKILDCPEFEAICRHDNAMRRYLEGRQLKVGMSGAGTYPIPVEELDEVYAWLTTHKATRLELCEAFYAVYEQRCEESDAKLASLGNAADHPPLEKVKAAFHLDWLPLSFDVPGAMRHLRSGLYERERARVMDQLQSATAEVENGLLNAMAQLVQELTATLEPTDATGKRKKFYGARLEHLTAFLEKFSNRNITNNDQLAAMAEQARALVEGTDVQMIRDSEELRATLHEEFTTLAQQLAGMARTDAPRRAIDLEESTDAA